MVVESYTNLFYEVNMQELIEHQKKALLIFTHAQANNTSAETQVYDTLACQELERLVENIGLKIEGTHSFRLVKPNASTFLGKGQVEDLYTLCKEKQIDIVVFNAHIGPRIQRNLEDRLACCVIDREEVIIQIFADRAQTAEAKIQAELASLRYSLPRLNRKWTQLSQQRGGAFHSRGAGETKLELSRRVAKTKIAQLNEKLAQVEKLRTTQRKRRLNTAIPIGSIIGYTNSGKSSLLQLLSKQETSVQDKLFATLDAQTKKVYLAPGKYTLLTDTVGFVDNLPHDLIDAFKSTLEETYYSDFLIIVCDASTPAIDKCLDVTLSVLKDLRCDEKKQILFINKMDSVYSKEKVDKIKARFPIVVEGSVLKKAGIETLMEKIQEVTGIR